MSKEDMQIILTQIQDLHNKHIYEFGYYGEPMYRMTEETYTDITNKLKKITNT